MDKLSVTRQEVESQGVKGCVVALEGALNDMTARTLSEELGALVESGTTYVILDLRGVTYLGSVGASVILSGRQRCKEAGGELMLVCEPGRPYEVLKSLAITSLVSTYEEVEEAVKNLGARARLKILVVDDEPDQVEVMSLLLGKRGHQALGCVEGFRALDLAREAVPDAIVLDLMMPGVNGYHVCQALRKDNRCRRIPVIVWTARKTERDRELARELGVKEFFEKPLGLESAVESVLEWAEKHYQARSAFLESSPVLLVTCRPELSKGLSGALAAICPGHRLLTAGSPEEAVQTAQAQDLSMIFIDDSLSLSAAPDLCYRIKMEPKQEGAPMVAVLDDDSRSVEYPWADVCLSWPAKETAILGGIEECLP